MAASSPTSRSRMASPGSTTGAWLSVINLHHRNGLRWCDAPKEYGPHKTLYIAGSAGARGACSPGSSRDWPAEEPEENHGDDRRDPISRRTVRRPACAHGKGGRGAPESAAPRAAMNTKLHARDRSAGGVRSSSFIKGGPGQRLCRVPRALCGSLTAVEVADRRPGLRRPTGFREALRDKGIRPCIPGRTSRGKAVPTEQTTVISAAIASRSCSVVLRTGGGSPTPTTNARRVLPVRQSRWPQPSIFWL